MQILPLSGYLFRLGDVAPAGGVAGTAEIVLDAVLENPCLHLLPYAHVRLSRLASSKVMYSAPSIGFISFICIGFRLQR